MEYVKSETDLDKENFPDDVKLEEEEGFRGRTDSTTSGQSTEVSELIPPPPDGGWGWAVVFAAFIINVVVDGICYAYGIIAPVFQDSFQATKAETSLIGSILIGFYLMMGPVVSALTNKFGCRFVTMLGAFISALAFFLGRFQNGVNGLIGCYGVLGGVGFGMMYLPAIVVVGFYFEEKRAFATGIVTSGSGVGTFVFAPLTQWLLAGGDWQNTLLVFCEISLQCVVMGALMRPLEAPTKKEIKERRKKNILKRLKELNKNPEEGEEEEKVSLKEINENGTKKVHLQEEKRGSDIHLAAMAASRKKKELEASQELTSPPSDLQVPTLVVTECEAYSTNSTGDVRKKKTGPVAIHPEKKSILDGFFSRREDRPMAAPNTVARDMNVMAERKGHAEDVNIPENRLMLATDPKRAASDIFEAAQIARRRKVKKELKELYVKPMYRKDIFYSGSMLHIPQYQSTPDIRTYVASITDVPDEDEKSIKETKCKCIPKEMRDALFSMMDFTLLLNPVFLLVAFANMLGMIGYWMPFMFLVDRTVKEAGVERETAAFLISIIGITNTIGRFLVGWVTDRFKLQPMNVNVSTLMIAGIATIAVPFTYSHNLAVAYAAVAGFFIAPFISLTSIILVELLGLEKLTNSFGLLLLFRGMASVVGPPFAGWLCDATGNYTASFFTGGAMLMMCAIMHMAAPCILSCQARRQKRKRGPTVPVPDTQPQVVQGEIIIMEKGWSPEN